MLASELERVVSQSSLMYEEMMAGLHEMKANRLNELTQIFENTPELGTFGQEYRVGTVSRFFRH